MTQRRLHNCRKSNMYCCVPQCNTYYSENVSFHIFPTYNKKLRDEWIRLLKIGKKVSQFMRVCSRHFREEDFFIKAHVNKRQRLKKNVVPSLNLPKTSHEKTVNEDLKKQRMMRFKNRQKSLSRNQNIDAMEVDQNKDETNTSPYFMTNSMDDIEAANILLSFTNLAHNEKDEQGTARKMCEDKAVQCNTYEEFNNFDVGDIIDTEKRLRILTGIYNFALLNVLVGTLLAVNTTKSKLNVRKKILLTLMRIKLDVPFTVLGVLFKVSAVSAKTYFYTTVHQLSSALNVVIRFPPKQEIVNNMPVCFKKFPQTRIILDCTEIEIQKSKCLKCRIKTYSFYKGRQTIKFLIGVAPSGLITYLSKPYGGRASDKAIFNKENLISKLHSPDAIMVDKGFLIDKECLDNGIKLIRPPFLRNKKQLSKEEAILNAKIARARVHIERRIQRIKLFRVCRNTIPWSLLPIIHKIMIIVVAITNLSPPILSSNKFCNNRN